MVIISFLLGLMVPWLFSNILFIILTTSHCRMNTLLYLHQFPWNIGLWLDVQNFECFMRSVGVSNYVMFLLDISLVHKREYSFS
jgi:hypothetical protein